MQTGRLPDKHLQKLATLIGSGQLTQARKLAESLVKKHPNNPDLWYNLAGLHAQTGNLDQVIHCCRQVTRLNPQHAGAFYNLGAALQQAGLYSDAIDAYKKCTTIESGNFNALLATGIACLELSDAVCAEKYLDAALKLAPRNGAALLHKGRLLDRLGQHEQASDYFRMSIQAEPGNPESHYCLGVALSATGKTGAACESYRKAIELKPDYIEALNNYGHTLNETGKLDQALHAFSKLLELQPDSAIAYNNLGIVYDSIGKTEEAESAYRNAIRIDPSLLETSCHLGYLLADEGRTAEALEIFDQILEQSPQLKSAIAGKATALEKLGDTEQARALLEKYAGDESADAEIVIAACKVALRTGEYDNAARRAENLVRSGNTTEKGLADLHFVLGDLYDKQEKYHLAFSHYKEANALSPCAYSHEQHIRYIDRIISATDSSSLDKLPDNRPEFRRLVFIVGMPRSGTSLVEQILASHPDVFGAGELRYIGDIAAALPGKNGKSASYPEGLDTLTRESLHSLAGLYTTPVNRLADKSPVITDKMPHNFLFLAFIHKLFPDAKIIHVKRNLLDNCLSLYFNSFNPNHAYSTDLGLLGKYYGEYLRLMRHWREQAGIPMLDIQYETLINDFDNCTSRLLDYCGLGWSDSCRDFHMNKRFVKTPSYNQVCQPLYSSSINRWKHYDEFIEELKESLHLNTDDNSWYDCY